jgi:3-methylcrotonyl-CoA carboxylase alpha subunit
MRVVMHHEELDDAILSAKRESLSSFGDDTIFLEKYLANARHIEVQIFRDTLGNAVHLFERDCSTQRRHQKIIEESPALDIPEEVKQKLYQAAINAAHAINYVGAGTIEFLYTQNNEFYFMEMNTRLQVEHPVTEMVTGCDLVEWQIKIAQGDPLPKTQAQIHSTGHAIEARIYAEDPYHQFLPVTGSIKKIMLPEDCAFRLDIGVQAGDKVSIYFDPMLAKMIVHAINRTAAIQTMQIALNQFHLIGLTTNLPFLRKILQDNAFQSGNMHTQYVESNLATLLSTPSALTTDSLALACLVALLGRKSQVAHEPNSPWNQLNAWRLNLPFEEILTLEYQHEPISVHVIHPKQNEPYYHLLCLEKKLDVQVRATLIADQIHATFPAYQKSAHFYIDETLIEIIDNGIAYPFKPQQFNIEHPSDPQGGFHQLIAPMPGIISKIWVKTGETVIAGSKLVALEAMKMEHTLSAPTDGLIKSIYYQVGDQVEEGCKLIDFE